MIKENLKIYLDKYFEAFKKIFGHNPTVPYDEDEESSLWIGEMDDEEYIQWMYLEKETVTDFSNLEKEIGLVLPEQLKEFYNSYYFLELQGFCDGEHVYFDSVSDTRDIINDLHIEEVNEKNYLHMGIYSNMDLELCMEIETGKMVSVDYEGDLEEVRVDVIADSLEELLKKMTATRNE